MENHEYLLIKTKLMNQWLKSIEIKSKNGILLLNLFGVKHGSKKNLDIVSLHTLVDFEV